MTISNEVLAEQVANMRSQIAAYHQDVSDLDDEVEKLEAKIAKMETDAVKRENARLLWGIGALGTVIMTLGGLLWQYIGPRP